MKLTALVAATLVVALTPACPPSPRPPTPTVDAGPFTDCDSMCADARARGCKEGFGGDAGTRSSCEAVCGHAVATQLTPAASLFSHCTPL